MRKVIFAEGREGRNGGMALTVRDGTKTSILTVTADFPIFGSLTIKPVHVKRLRLTVKISSFVGWWLEFHQFDACHFTLH